jgi:hypothetical protein
MHRTEKPRDLVRLTELPPDILQLVDEAHRQVGDIISMPDMSEHVVLVRPPGVKINVTPDDEL